MRIFFFDMKDGVPMRDRIGIDFKNDLEAIEHCKELAQQFRDGSLRVLTSYVLRQCSRMTCPWC
jgi:hypothetical protein